MQAFVTKSAKEISNMPLALLLKIIVAFNRKISLSWRKTDWISLAIKAV